MPAICHLLMCLPSFGQLCAGAQALDLVQCLKEITEAAIYLSLLLTLCWPKGPVPHLLTGSLCPQSSPWPSTWETKTAMSMPGTLAEKGKARRRAESKHRFQKNWSLLGVLPFSHCCCSWQAQKQCVKFNLFLRYHIKPRKQQRKELFGNPGPGWGAAAAHSIARPRSTRQVSSVGACSLGAHCAHAVSTL